MKFNYYLIIHTYFACFIQVDLILFIPVMIQSIYILSFEFQNNFTNHEYSPQCAEYSCDNSIYPCDLMINFKNKNILIQQNTDIFYFT